MSFNLPCPSLEGIILVASTHNGPHFSFCYPPSLTGSELDRGKAASNDDQLHDEDFIQEDEIGDTYEELLDFNQSSSYLGTKKDILTVLDSQERLKRAQNADDQSSSSLQGSGKALRQVVSNSSKSSAANVSDDFKKVLGFDREYLSEMLCPPRSMCNSRFEVMIEKTVFLGLPIHVGADGSWRPGRPPSKRKKAADTENPEEEENSANNSMSMFHLVFVLRPPEIERNYRVDEMFYCVTSKLSLVLRYEQSKRDYVWSQIRLISRLGEEWRTQSTLQVSSMTEYLISKSSLCKLIADCYEAISTSKIATLTINNKRKSFQIPIKKEFLSLPDPTVPFLPGSHLSSTANMLAPTGLVSLGETTRYHNRGSLDFLQDGRHDGADGANSSDNEDTNATSSDDIIYFALLLYDNPETIIDEIKAESQGLLAKFIKMIRPTESLLKVTNRMRATYEEKIPISISLIKSFAFQLVYWRKARMVAPLNTRAIYIVSPMAPLLSNFRKDIKTFKENFSTLPSLPSFLKLLSTRSKKPKQFASIIPSKDHKEPYLQALAWLIRFGYVTQLHTYIWLKVPRKVRMRVEEELESEGEKTSKRKSDGENKDLSAVDNKVDNKVGNEVDNKVGNGVDNKVGVVNSSSPIKTRRVMVGSQQSDLEEEIEQMERKLGMTNMSSNLNLEEEDDTILVDPGRASSLERRWINRIIHQECKLSPDLTTIFFKLLKYMNGKNSLELLLLKENVTRVELRKLLLAIEDYIISVRHW